MDEEQFRLLREDLLKVATRAGTGWEAEDLVQDCMMAILLAAPRDLRAYAFGALYRRIALHWRTGARRSLQGSSSAIAEILASANDDEALHCALQLDGALELVADGGQKLHLRVADNVAAAWASEVVDQVATLLGEIGSLTTCTPRHARRLRVGLMQKLRDRAPDVSVEVVDHATIAHVVARGLRGGDVSIDREQLGRRCGALRTGYLRKQSG